MMGRADTTLPVRERILNTAVDLFYRQGYRATGINQVIAESGVAKASFYDHFPSKNDLLVAYAGEMARYDLEEIRAEIAKESTPRKRFVAPLKMLPAWFEQSGYRGCPFQNLAAEMAVEVPAVLAVTQEYRKQLRALLVGLARDLQQAGQLREGEDPEMVGSDYQVILEGAIATSVAYRDPWPIRRGLKMLEQRMKGR